jgi:serine/threonine protein phosphatase 1
MRPRLHFDDVPAVLYAVGDVHGCLDQLLDLERQIVADAKDIAGEKWLVMLGDYIDRGPASAQVIEHAIAPPPPGWRRLCLFGNHEEHMVKFLDQHGAHERWLEQGGIEALISYGVEVAPDTDLPTLADRLSRILPTSHRDFLDALPVILTVGDWVFVHAGIRPGIPIEDQREEDLYWIRQPFLSAELPGKPTIVHGHTPGNAPVVAPGRIGIDTHCFHTGLLTALRVNPDGTTKFLHSMGTS